MPKAKQTVQRRDADVVEQWLLSVLRFAVTLDETDRGAVLSLAAGMDRPDSGFTFFVKTSVKVCDAIVAKDCAEAASALRVFVHAIHHVRLRRAFEAMIDINQPDRGKASARIRERLFRGLPIVGAGTVPRRSGEGHTK
jgi:hypothetical protein